MKTLHTEAWLPDGSRVVVPERKYMKPDGSDRHYRVSPLRGSAHTMAVFFNAAPSTEEQWECVGWCLAE